ncbi:MAG TPA: hypothetical protein PKD86_07875 [Gemmatales bacterium]|nr:hypothetical protein [Gemmatales bacterium]HMP59256.1 hypothetical protein [Gemmatales bacterium]
MITLTCPSCQKTLSAPDKAVGKQATCPGCGTAVAVPLPPAATPMPDTVKMSADQIQKYIGTTKPPTPPG